MKIAFAGLAALGALVASGSGTPAVAASPVAAPKTVCTGVPHCTIVAAADIDGDEKADQIGIVGKDLTTQDGTIVVRVRTATGRTMQTTGSDVNWYTNAFHGVAAIDGKAGMEIVVGDMVGAHAIQERVVTYRDGKLVTLRPPPGRASYLTRASRWATDSSINFHNGWFRSVSSTGVVTLTRTEAVRNASGESHTGQSVAFRWESGTWVEVSSETKHYTDKQASAIGGWHVKGLSTWPR